ncbi:MAG: hypothetical protein ACLR23_21445 [Clostridia bacterium]
MKDKHGKVHYIVDGGLLSNYPMWILDDGKSNPERPVFGFKFVDDPGGKEHKDAGKMNVFSYLTSIVSTAVDSWTSGIFQRPGGLSENGCHTRHD